MRLCMFHPGERPMERGWVGRVDGDRVVHLAAQTLQSFFLGGGGAREHAEYPLDDVRLLAPVLHPPSVRIFDSAQSFEFANPAAVLSPDAEAPSPAGANALEALVRPAAVVGQPIEIGGFTILGEVRAHGLEPPKDRDFALFLGPVVVTPDEVGPPGLDWEAALAYAAANTVLRAGDVVAGPPLQRSQLGTGSFQLALDGIGTLRGSV
jgi:Domain of unknown function (DUF2437)